MDIVIHILIALAVGFFISFAVVTSMKAQLKSVVQKQNATDYVIANSLHLDVKRDQFLYTRVEKREKPQQQNSQIG